MNNITVSHSAIGVLNTGSLEIVDSAISALKEQPQTQDIAEAIKSLTNAIAAASELTPENRNEAIETLSIVASEATAPKEKRKVAVVKRLLSNLPDVIKTSAAAMTVWSHVAPVIHSLFP